MSGHGREPTFGHGEHARPLWTKRDRDAEEIRAVLRRSGYREFTGRHGGFVVEAGRGDGFLVVCAETARRAVNEVPRYASALTAAGYQAAPDPDDDQVLRVWRHAAPPAAPERRRPGVRSHPWMLSLAG